MTIAATVAVLATMSTSGSGVAAGLTTSNGGLVGAPRDTSGPDQTFLDFTGGVSKRLPYPAGDPITFSPDGDAVAYQTVVGNKRVIRIRYADGHLVSWPATSTAHTDLRALAWESDTTLIAASEVNADHQDLYRISADQGPVRLVQTDNSTVPFTLNPGRGTLLFIAGDGEQSGVWTLDLGTPGAAPSKITNECVARDQDGTCLESVDYTAISWTTGARAIVGYIHCNGCATSAPAQSTNLGYLNQGGKPDPIRTTDDVVYRVLMSPDGAKVAWETDRGINAVTMVAPVAGGNAATVAGESHQAWQPCPNGTCPTFTRGTAPGAPTIGNASSGSTGGKVNATARWSAPASSGTSPIKGYVVMAARLDSHGHIVSTRSKTLNDASARSYVWSLAAGRYKFRVRAGSEAGDGPWSAYSNVVAAR